MNKFSVISIARTSYYMMKLWCLFCTKPNMLIYFSLKQQFICRHVAPLGYIYPDSEPSNFQSPMLHAYHRNSKYQFYSLVIEPIIFNTWGSLIYRQLSVQTTSILFQIGWKEKKSFRKGEMLNESFLHDFGFWGMLI